MSESELVSQEAAAPLLAVQALTAAHRRVRESGRPVVLVADGKLVRVSSKGTIVLKELPARVKVAVRSKQATA